MKSQERELWLYPQGQTFDKERGYKHTKVKHIKIYKVDPKEKIIFDTDVATWASAIRLAIDVLKPMYQDDASRGTFEPTFNKELNKYLDENQFAPNANFSRTIFTDDSWMTSSLYKESKNHRLLLFRDSITWEDKCICAVYADEVVWVLQALLNSLSEDYSICINYIPRENLGVREDITAGMEERGELLDKNEFTKDMLCLQMEVAQVHSQIMAIHTHIEKISEKYGFNPQEYLDKMMGLDRYKDMLSNSTENQK